VETGPQIKPRDALQQTFQVPSAEALPIGLQVDFRLASTLSPQIATRDAVDLAVGFASRVASRTTVRTTPGTVPGTVPTVVPGRQIQTGSTAPNVLFYG